MKLRLAVAVVCFVAGFSGFSCSSGLPHHEDFSVGMSREDVLARFGKPDREQHFTKSDERIWGPIEDFWPRVPVGGTVEIWAFRSTSSESPGQSELYFVNGSETVDGVRFYIEGAVYESQ